MPTSKEHRKYLKSDLWLEMRDTLTDQQQRLPHPPVEQPFADGLPQFDLVSPDAFSVGTLSVREAIAQRRSLRTYSDLPLSLEELSYLAWATQGVHEVWRGGISLRRTVPSAGARHPFETYVVVNHVEGLDMGLYRYLSVEHRLLLLRADPELPAQAAAACHGQGFVARAAATFIWTAIPYRTEWRYAVMAPKLVNLDAGHVCHSLYLAAESIGAGVCAIAAYSQAEMDALLGVDGEDEFAIYVAPVGKP
jgi:SagB-type dehydrogenase family enzyme